MTKRIISLILILLLVSSSAFASEIFPTDTEEISFEVQQEVFRTGGVSMEATEITIPPEMEVTPISFFASVSFGDILPEIVEAWIEEYDELPTLITGIESFGITPQTLEEGYYIHVTNNPQLLLHTECEYITNSEGIITILAPKFLVETVEEYREAQKAMEDGMKEYLDLANQHETDLEKLLAIHDKMVENCTYDDRVNSNDPSVKEQVPDTVQHALGVFRDKLAVCQGYSQALYMLGKELGIEMDFCVSEEINHMWNYVKLNNKWYHMDMTNEDLSDPKGLKASHNYFLVSDSGLKASAHGTDWRIYGTDERYPCNDTTYQQNHFFNIGISFHGYREEDGYYHMRVTYTNKGLGISSAPVDIKTKSLYTGAVVAVAYLAEGTYTTTVDGQKVQKTGTNIYLTEFTTRAINESFSITTTTSSKYNVLPSRPASAKNKSYTRGLQANVSPNFNLSRFSSFVLDLKTLEPYAFKTQWYN